MTNTKTILELVKDQFFAHGFTYKGIALAIASFFFPLISLFVILLSLMVIDIITAMIAAKKAKINVTSKKYREFAPKSLIYFFLIIAAKLLDEATGLERITGFSAAKMMCGLLAFAEILSIGENVSPILGFDVIRIGIKFFMRKYIQREDIKWEEMLDEFQKKKEIDFSKQKLLLNTKLLSKTIKILKGGENNLSLYQVNMWHEYAFSGIIGIYTKLIFTSEQYSIFNTIFDVNSRFEVLESSMYGYIYVKAGTLKLKIDGKTFILEPNSFFEVPKGKHVMYYSEESADILFLGTLKKSNFYKINEYI